MMSFRDSLTQTILQQGPLGLEAFMEACNQHYYRTRDPLGEAGDFTTAPEISQMFGEMVAVWLLNALGHFGSLNRFTLLECGPGRGTLMADILRILSKYIDVKEQVHLVLMECSDTLKAVQEEKLRLYQPQWIGRVTDPVLDAAPGPVFVIGNEFLDALPIRQRIFTEDGWRERTVEVQDGAFIWGQRPIPSAVTPSAPASIPVSAPRIGDIFEDSPAITSFTEDIAALLSQKGGAALWIDYGYDTTSVGDSFQALQRHAYTDPLEAPGEADLTAHVNFAAVADVLRRGGLTVSGPVSQRQFLLQSGLLLRAERLKLVATESQRQDIDAALNRLISPQEMGHLFKVLEVSTHPLQSAGFL